MSQEMDKNEIRQDEICRHEWTEDGATFTVAANPEGPPYLIGERFTGWSGHDEAVLAREVLRQAERIESYERVRVLQASELHKNDAEISRLTDRLNALTARIEEALDLLVHETEGSRRVEQAYMLEKVMVDNLGKELAK